jgi:hypothetical protein
MDGHGGQDSLNYGRLSVPPNHFFSLFNLEYNPLAVFRELSGRLARL